MKKWCVTMLLSVCACAAQTAQPLRGEIRSDLAEDLSWLTVHLDSPGIGRAQSTGVSFRGDFEFTSVPAGVYTLRVMDASGREMLSEPVNLGGSNPPISLRLPGTERKRPTGETISLERLRHKVNRQAMQAARKAEKLAQRRDYQGAVDMWRKALAADPEFSEAYANLGTEYVKLHRPAEAVEPYRRAIALDPHTPGHQTNLAFALAQLGQFEEAEALARGSLRLNDTVPLTHYVLGCVLIMAQKSMTEAIQQLRIAGRQFSPAHEVLARVYQAQGQTALATAEMQLYADSRAASGTKLPASGRALLAQ